MKIQDIIKMKHKNRLLSILILLVDQFQPDKSSKNMTQVGITAKGILKYLYRYIQPTTYFVQILGQNVNKIQYRKLLEFYKLDPKDFVPQDPNSLYEDSNKNSVKNAARKLAQERIEKLKQQKRNKQDLMLERQKKIMEMKRKKVFHYKRLIQILRTMFTN